MSGGVHESGVDTSGMEQVTSNFRPKHALQSAWMLSRAVLSLCPRFLGLNKQKAARRKPHSSCRTSQFLYRPKVEAKFPQTQKVEAVLLRVSSGSGRLVLVSRSMVEFQAQRRAANSERPKDNQGPLTTGAFDTERARPARE